MSSPQKNLNQKTLFSSRQRLFRIVIAFGAKRLIGKNRRIEVLKLFLLSSTTQQKVRPVLVFKVDCTRCSLLNQSTLTALIEVLCDSNASHNTKFLLETFVNHYTESLLLC